MFLRARFAVCASVKAQIDALVAILVNIQIPACNTCSTICAVVQVISRARRAVRGRVHTEILASRAVLVEQLGIAVAVLYRLAVYLARVALEPVLALELLALLLSDIAV